MRQARNTSSSVFAQILQLNSKYESPLFCCFEGEDFKYYGIRVEQIKVKQHDKTIALRCGGKKEVIRLYELVSKAETLNERDIIYFIDKDFDESIGELSDSIYETPCYSIENFYTTKCVFEKILTTELKIEETNPLYQYCIDIFSERQKEFHLGVLYLNAWIYCQRKANVDKLYLNEFKLNKLINSLSLEVLVFNAYDKNFLKDCFPNAIELSDLQISNAMEIIKDKPQEKFRGKFEIEFIYEFLTVLIQTINKKTSSFEKCKKVGLNLSKLNILSELSQYALTPDCLKEYIKKSA